MKEKNSGKVLWLATYSCFIYMLFASFNITGKMFITQTYLYVYSEGMQHYINYKALTLANIQYTFILHKQVVFLPNCGTTQPSYFASSYWQNEISIYFIDSITRTHNIFIASPICQWVWDQGCRDMQFRSYLRHCHYYIYNIWTFSINFIIRNVVLYCQYIK